MGDQVTIEVEAPSSEAELETAQVETEAETEQVEATVEAAVQIAEIEANKEIILAEIQAEARVAEAEAYSETIHAEQRDYSWQQNIETQLADLTGKLETLAMLLTPPASVAQEASPNPTEQESAVSDQTPVNPDQDAPEVAPEPPKPRKKSRWI